MDRTLRKVLGARAAPDGTSVIVGLETVEGVTVEIEIIPEAIMELILVLLEGRTEAWVRAEGGVEAPIPSERDRIRGVIPATRILSGEVAQTGERLYQIETKSGAILEFLLPPVRRSDQATNDQ